MAKPQKTNAEYFGHDAGMRNDLKVKALRRKFGNEGYSVWCFILEVLTDSNGFEIEFNEVQQELMAADFDIKVEELTDIVDYCLKIGLLQLNDDVLYSQAHKGRFAGLLDKRNTQREWINARRKQKVVGATELQSTNGNMPHVDIDNQSTTNRQPIDNQSTTNRQPIDNPQSKVKDSKVKDSIVIIDDVDDNTRTREKKTTDNIKALKKETLWLEKMSMAISARGRSASPVEIIAMLDDFSVDCDALDNLDETLSQTKRHFFNWAIKQIEKNKQRNDTRTDDKRRAAIEKNFREQDYTQGF